jgi:NADH-quinone oxidoreductase subunit M
MKKLIAYSSVAHMGFVTLGIFVFTARGIEGAVFQMLNHGITTGALFMLVGAIYERTHSREIADNLGLAKYLPAYIGFFGLFSMSSLGFPGTNSFVGEALVLIGAFQNNVIVGALAIPGAMIAAAYMLRLLQKLAWGSPSAGKGLSDLNCREWAYILPLAVLVLYLGLAPTLTRLTIDASIPKTISRVQTVLEDKRPDLVMHMTVNTPTSPQGVQ